MDKRSFLWSRLFLIGLVASCALLTVAGIAATYVPLPLQLGEIEIAAGALDALCALAFAGIAGFALGVSQMAAAMAVTLRAPQHRHGRLCAFNLAVGCSMVCGLISLGGIHLGAERLGLDPFWLDVAGGALCLVKPTMSYLTEASREVVRQAAQARADAADQRFYDDRRDSRDLERERLGAAKPAAPPTPEPEPKVDRSLESRRRDKRRKAARVAKQAAAALMGAAAAAGTATALEPAAITGAERIGNPRPSFDDIDRAKAALEARGVEVTQSALAAHIGCSRSSVRRALGVLR